MARLRDERLARERRVSGAWGERLAAFSRSRRWLVGSGATLLAGAGLIGLPGSARRIARGVRQAAEPPEPPEPLPPPSPTSRTATLVTELRAPDFDDGHVRYLIEVLARSGIATYAEPTGGEPLREPRTPAAPVQVIAWQARNLALEVATGAGMLGAELDAQLPPAAGLPPLSSLLAGYVAMADTPGGAFCRGLLAEQELRRPSELRLPGIVLLLCAADLAVDAAVAAGSASDAVRPLVLPANLGACSAFQTFTNVTLESVVNTLAGAAAEAAPLPAALWPFAVATAGTEGTDPALAPAEEQVRALRASGAPLALLAHLLSASRAWLAAVTPSPAATRLAVGDEADLAGTIDVQVSTGGLDGWPAELADCAALAGLDPPPAPGAGAALTVEIEETPVDLVAEGEAPATLADDGRATFSYVTNREASDAGAEQVGTLRVGFALGEDQLAVFAEALAGEIIAGLPPVVTESLAGAVAEPAAIGVAVGALARVAATAVIPVTYHEQEASTPVATSEPATAETETPGAVVETPATVETPAGETPATGATAPVVNLPCPGGRWEAINIAEVVQETARQEGVVVTAAEGSVIYTLELGGVLTIAVDTTVTATVPVEGGGSGEATLTLRGTLPGIWQDLITALALAPDFAALEVETTLTVDGAPVETADLELFDLGVIFGNATIPYECGDETLLLIYPTITVPLLLVR